MPYAACHMGSPPSSSFLGFSTGTTPLVTDDLGMIVEDGAGQSAGKSREQIQDVTVVHKKRKPRKYFSKHFPQRKPTSIRIRAHEAKDTTSVQSTVAAGRSDNIECLSSLEESMPDPQQPQPRPRVFYGLNVDELSSDSDLTDVPSDIGPDPFELSGALPNSDTKAFKVKHKSRSLTKSPYFPNTIHRHRQHFLTTLPFPSLDHPHFGLMQERLAHDPFRLLIATIFLNKTPGARAMPIFFELMNHYPSPMALSEAKVEDVTEIIRTLGFQNQRASKCVAMAKVWVASPPMMGKRYRKLNYPAKGDGRDVKEGEVIGDDDKRIAWEISHLPGLGPYSHDSWRMFCRDKMRGLACDWLGKGAENGFEPEWKRVLPTDKELRAWMTWMWLKEGWIWNKDTGSLSKADDQLLKLAQGGGVVHESTMSDHLVVKGLDQETILDKSQLDHRLEISCQDS